MTPGIRLSDSSQNDQKRVATPTLAKQKGADLLVIGRSVTQATNPPKKLSTCYGGVESCLNQKR
ncbi:orotidine 5'-phosphate decarboxylase [Gracilibacillus boraciitolerans JCM 21714]|uniref:Orotidine 5'-phosphate decarboxylase n=1 Tax=Gracilibacillus boraciitolerans JCM 21714 TaxID=1298598 RepID=W4VEU6_9BACI|nr:orotidine 5'-phosphate decarboxylase [Gracilibacillus boraciitolerans JCM 21714]